MQIKSGITINVSVAAKISEDVMCPEKDNILNSRTYIYL